MTSAIFTGRCSPPPAHAWWPYAIVGIVAVRDRRVVVRYAIVWRRRRAGAPPTSDALLALDAARELIERGDPERSRRGVSTPCATTSRARSALHAPRLTTEELLAT